MLYKYIFDKIRKLFMKIFVQNETRFNNMANFILEKLFWDTGSLSTIQELRDYSYDTLVSV